MGEEKGEKEPPQQESRAAGLGFTVEDGPVSGAGGSRFVCWKTKPNQNKTKKTEGPLIKCRSLRIYSHALHSVPTIQGAEMGWGGRDRFSAWVEMPALPLTQFG